MSNFKFKRWSLLMLTSMLLLSSCYDDDPLWNKVNELDNRLTTAEQQLELIVKMNKEVEDIKKVLSALQNNVYVTNIQAISNGYILTLSDNSKITIMNGSDGQTPFIGGNGNWWIGTTDTGVQAKGENGKDGQTPFIGGNGNWWIGTTDTGVQAKGEDGKDGQTPFVGSNGNWWIGTTDTGVQAKGQDGTNGLTPYVGENGNWWIGNDDTGVPAMGRDGKSPYVGNNGNWWIDGRDSGVCAVAQDGQTPYIGENGNWWIGDIDTGVAARGTEGGGSAPIIGIDEYEGVYYWTLTTYGQTSWLLDKDGNKMPVSGVAPLFKVDMYGYLVYSIDNGLNWISIIDDYGNHVQIGGNCSCTQFFQNVYVSGSYLYIILIDGTEIKIYIGNGGNRGDIPEDPTDPTPSLPGEANIMIPYPSLIPEVDEYGNHVISVTMTGIQDPNTMEWVALHGTGLTQQNIWIDVDGSPKGIFVINLEDNTSHVKNDIVFTVDNSGSMSEEANAIARDIISWAEALTNKNLDVKFGVVGYGGYVDGAMNLTNASELSSYLNKNSGTARTQYFGGSDASDLSSKANSFARTSSSISTNECGAMAIRFADEYFNHRATANRVYINFTDEPNQPNGNTGYSVEWFKGQQNWKTSNGTIHTVYSYASFSTDNINYSERPWLLSEYTGGTTMFIKSDASDLQLDQLTVSDALTHAYTIKFIIPESLLDGMPHTVHIVVIANDGTVRGELTFTAVFGAL